MRDSSNRQIIIVGLFIFVGVMFLVAGVFVVGRLHKTFESKINVVAFFDDVTGLQQGNSVRCAGVNVGTVSSISIVGISKVKVVLSIDLDATKYIRKNAKIKVGTDGLIGNRILIIAGGTINSPEITNNDTLRVEATITPEEIMNVFQENNKNLLAITSDFKVITKQLVNGEGSIGKMLNNNELYNNIKKITKSIENTSVKTQRLIESLNKFSSKLNKKGTLIGDLTSDTLTYNSIKISLSKLQNIADSATELLNSVKLATDNPKTSVGVLLHDQETGVSLKKTIKKLESSSIKLDEDLEALQHSFFLRHFFKKKLKKENNN